MQAEFKIEEMRNSAESVVTTLKSLANTDRLLILCHLAQEELNVSQIEERTQISQPTLSQQLMMLRKSEVVHTRRAGKQIFYSIKDQKLIDVLATLYRLYCPQSL
ncbi:helix-turn-helix transcriptional regulator [Acinetobacter sp. S40]|uniref:ArsR/SmtB family transcription factor n=1 Tax=unclassified Acinetobacter TaxID=196816 RepID=UPI00190A1193|nr:MULTISPECIES: metalloregulator ArsR/SmtB family transcription factor [unclassified Acinetobacter]MBJ9985234.1 helix-turn-helix transcriptional regulator [Acinetobacter sp. S40]MBK0063279.1 helix-turn-helix transcriptional regulator [Acinetobacter sp. S55]MBK0066809.1 helix-turn-helix transcriptional regulator [Acinetobacter sp. S54]